MPSINGSTTEKTKKCQSLAYYYSAQPELDLVILVILILWNVEVFKYWTVNSHTHCMKPIVNIYDSTSDGRSQRWCQESSRVSYLICFSGLFCLWNSVSISWNDINNKKCAQVQKVKGEKSLEYTCREFFLQRCIGYWVVNHHINETDRLCSSASQWPWRFVNYRKSVNNAYE